MLARHVASAKLLQRNPGLTGAAGQDSSRGVTKTGTKCAGLNLVP